MSASRRRICNHDRPELETELLQRRSVHGGLRLRPQRKHRSISGVYSRARRHDRRFGSNDRGREEEWERNWKKCEVRVWKEGTECADWRWRSMQVLLMPAAKTLGSIPGTGACAKDGYGEGEEEKGLDMAMAITKLLHRIDRKSVV